MCCAWDPVISRSAAYLPCVWGWGSPPPIFKKKQFIFLLFYKMMCFCTWVCVSTVLAGSGRGGHEAGGASGDEPPEVNSGN